MADIYTRITETILAQLEQAARQVGLGRSTLYRELALMPEIRRWPP